MDTKTKHRRLMALLSKAGIDEKTRHDLVYSWTKGRTQSSAGLTDQELIDVIWKMEHDASFAPGNLPRTTTLMLELELKKKRSTVLAIAQRVGIHEGTNFQKFNAWMKARSIHKKLLAKYTPDELDNLIKQMHALEDHFKKSALTPGTKAWHQFYGIPETSEN